ncbi:FkbM family methyltransferase [Mycobacterium helveticum]|uniref:FkbM family methyltransferase n=1 Tax=Mycobacterium helveticum TaxID=2592811 RepID=A0A557XYB8_9MYCO|nr:FkbM family methyltransferase [Mycobacterium helveticum]TVS86808.1 FkbM family methyltransferase [Mycobacterium helveticum]TVS91157.1 FkbM family methyltransferase [Mycobacterium helveticum]
MPVAHSARHWLAPAARSVAPRLFWRRKYHILRRLGQSRPDVQLAASLCDPNRISLDIGADVGEYTIAMSASSRSVIAFEPRPAQARDLASMFHAVGAAVRVEAVALSDTSGVATMRLVESEPGRSTIDTDNVLGNVNGSRVTHVDVPVTRLDDLHLGDIGLMKIDVEGHEFAVLRGAADTLTRNRPAVLVEAEERHHPNALAEITEFLTGLGYAGHFQIGEARLPVEEFDAAEHQNPANIGGPQDGWSAHGAYVNNFVFVPSEMRDRHPATW